MKSVNVYPIGKVKSDQDKMKIVLDDAYRAGLKGLSGFSHALVLWWADRCSRWPQSREKSASFDWAAEFGF